MSPDPFLRASHACFMPFGASSSWHVSEKRSPPLAARIRSPIVFSAEGGVGSCSSRFFFSRYQSLLGRVRCHSSGCPPERPERSTSRWWRERTRLYESTSRGFGVTRSILMGAIEGAADAGVWRKTERRSLTSVSALPSNITSLLSSNNWLRHICSVMNISWLACTA